MGIKYATQSTPQTLRLPDDQVVAIVAGSVFSTGDLTIETSIAVAKDIIKLSKGINGPRS